jgi:hypothetical protein
MTLVMRNGDVAPAGPAVAIRRSPGHKFILLLLGSLLGYALAGRGFAYVGIAPLFISEIALAIGVVVLFRTHGWYSLLQMPPVIALAALVGWCISRTVPYLGYYGLDAVRDSAIYYYSGYAIIVAAILISEPTLFRPLFSYYKQFVRIFLVGIPLVALAYRFGHDLIPQWPWAATPILQEKEGDVMVHLAGILAFWAAGTGGAPGLGWSMLLAADAALLGVIDRSGLLAFLAVLALVMMHKPLGSVPWRLISAGVLAIALIWVSGIDLPIPGGKGRELSFQQIEMNVTSLVSDTGRDGMDSTKEWRLAWWHTIWTETVDGPFFWRGRGFGINIADDDGFQVQADHSLRSPHSAHMTFLARAGVPGLALWIVTQLAWGGWMLSAYVRSRRGGDSRWQGVFFLLLAYWVAFLINASFDVYLEGPMGGIWFWTVWGVGLGALALYERRPEVLYQP